MLEVNMAILQTELPTATPAEEETLEILPLSEIRTKVAELSSSLQEPGVNQAQVLEKIDALVMMAAGLDQLCDKVANRRGLERRLEEEVYRASRTGSPLVLLILDLDNFKPVNDILGHKAGDKVLQNVGAKLKAGVKRTDMVARMGGDEFGILLPETSIVHGLVVAVRILLSIPELTPPSPSGRPPLPKLAASIGIAQLVPGEEAETFFVRADRDGLLAAKEGGKNAIGLVVSGDQNFSISGLQSQILKDNNINPEHKKDLIHHIMENTLLISK